MEDTDLSTPAPPAKRKLVNIYLDAQELGEVEKFKQTARLPTRMAAIRLLLAAGYESLQGKL